LKEEALDRTMWRHRFGGGFGPVVRQNTEWMNEMSMSEKNHKYYIIYCITTYGPPCISEHLVCEL